MEENKQPEIINIEERKVEAKINSPVKKVITVRKPTIKKPITSTAIKTDAVIDAFFKDIEDNETLDNTTTSADVTAFSENITIEITERLNTKKIKKLKKMSNKEKEKEKKVKAKDKAKLKAKKAKKKKKEKAKKEKAKKKLKEKKAKKKAANKKKKSNKKK